jgi:hypothetical protein
VTSRLKSRLERLESHAIPEASERQTIEIQFISPEKVVTSTLSVTLGRPCRAKRADSVRCGAPETPTDNVTYQAHSAVM